VFDSNDERLVRARRTGSAAAREGRAPAMATTPGAARFSIS
jgi:hypothetical protein